MSEEKPKELDFTSDIVLRHTAGLLREELLRVVKVGEGRSQIVAAVNSVLKGTGFSLEKRER